MTHNLPLIPACRLWKKQSAAGQTYLTGRLGGLRVLIMANKERQGEDDHTHVMLITAAPDSGAAQTTSSTAAPDATPDARPEWAKKGSARSRRAPENRRVQITDDKLPF
jgi:hypothetical protein